MPWNWPFKLPRRSFRTQPTRPGTRGRGFTRLRLEPLEDRNLLATFLVSNTNDSGLGSLRQAIMDANSTSGTNRIEFNISGTGVHTIQPGSALPALTGTVAIDGTTEPGYAGSPLIVLNGGAAGAAANGLTLRGSGSAVKGLVINGFAQAGLLLTVGGNDTITANYIGTDAAGTNAVGNLTGVMITGASNTIGGTAAGAGNLISGNRGAGIQMGGQGVTGNTVQGNRIGTDATGTLALGNATGVQLDAGSDTNTIGGTAAGAGNVISGNRGDGITFRSSGTAVQGNIIGANAAGDATLPNGGNGVTIIYSTDTIGGTTPGSRNLISGNQHIGVHIGGQNCQVQGNYIGTDITGTAALPNGDYGVSTSNDSNNLIGGTAAGAGNVISGNHLDGVWIAGFSDRVQGNYIGTDATGMTALGNGDSGVFIFAQGNTVGGSAPGAGNLISGNLGDGVLVRDGADVVQGNLIGTNATGTRALPNTGNGLLVLGGSNLIGGTTPEARNVISGNLLDGIDITSFGFTDRNQVQGNYIGTDSTGTRGLGNGRDGVRIFGGTTNNTIGGTAVGVGNLVSGNTGAGIYVSGTNNNQVQGNTIGTDATGTHALANQTGIVISFGSLNLIGGTQAGAGNLISGNTLDGVQIINSFGANSVQNNRIGTDVTGTLALGNTNGIELGAGAAGEFIGGPGTGNLISGNTGTGLVIGARRIVVQGNLIGTDRTGSVALPNRNGVSVSAGGFALNNTIGGTVSDAGNVISGNTTYGIEIANTAALYTLIQGNRIGTNAAGTAAVGNAYGVFIVGADNTTIGGTDPGAGNLISGNRVYGIAITANSATVQGNLLGTDATGTMALGNSTGVTISGSNNLIGGPADGARNIISGNLGDGVTISGGSGNTIQGNYIGTDVAGTHALGNTRGFFIRAASNTIAGNVISGNRSNGLELDLPAGNNNVVQGNKVGTDASGLVALANNGVGIGIQTSGNLIGGAAAGQGNLISGNSAYGVEIFAGSGNTIQGNLIGTDATGAAAVANFIGIFVGAGANTIGGTAVGAGNLISGNTTSGILLASSGNLVQGNLIGLDATGTLALANTDGLTVSSANNTIGGTAVGARNIISGNQNAGIRVFGGGVIQGNYIGTDASGTAAVGNAIGVSVSASNTTIGGTAAGAGNVISGNRADGIAVAGNGTTIQGNYIGTDATGTVALRNATGVRVSATGTTVGGTDVGAGNVISGNVSYGLYVQAGSSNLVEGNYFGTDATGTAALGNSYDIRIDSSNNTVGGTAAGARNLIAGSFTGVYVFSGTGNLIQGNYIGTDVTGTQALGNTFGVLLAASQSGATVGGTATGAGNLISGNTSDGLQIFSDGNVVQGNTIGTDVTGTAALGNGGDGVIVTNGSNNLLGGTAAGAGNLISGNGGDGIGLAASTGSGTGNVIQGNRIGTDTTGTAALGNGRGIYLNNMTGTTVGGTADGAGNLISGNAGDGIFFFVGGNNLVQGNHIGTDASGALALGNGGSGVDLSAGAHDNAIGGAAPGAGNVIAFNGRDGVLIDGGDGNLVSHNSIFANAHLGIELLDHGNNDQAAPELTSAKAHRRPGLGGFTAIKGTFTGQPFTTYTLEFYADSGSPAQGRQFLGSIAVTLGADGTTRFSLSIDLGLSPGEFVTATATDPNNNTSSFSAGVAVTGA